MRIFNRQAELIAFLNEARQTSRIGFVPTMGALHDGHLSLVRQSMQETDITVVSIFVNPTQFTNADDLKNYPRTLERDTEKIAAVNSDCILFAPSIDEMYDGNTVSESFDFDGLEHEMEGKFRPGHFNGVGTIVKRLFEIVHPDRAYFGEKDFQQLQVVRKLVEKSGLPVIIVGCPIYREANGLAMSSRNERLSPELRREASLIFEALNLAKSRFTTRTPEQIRTEISEHFAGNKHFTLEYFEIADEQTLKPVAVFAPERKYRAFIAVFAENVRLIDTIALN